LTQPHVFADTTLLQRPIGVFDSGVGGLSVLRALRAELPHEDFVYVADSGFAPYGEREECFVVERSRFITQHLLTHEQQPIKALVIACNTATAAAIHLLRQELPKLPIVGVEPALKPAVASSRTKRIGVMATRGTLASAKFKSLRARLHTQAEFICQPCDGLADAIEHADTPKIIALCEDYIRAIGQFGMQDGQVDTLVLGCTHYPFASTTLQSLLPAGVQLIDNGAPVARQTHRVVTPQASSQRTGQIRLCTTGDPALLAQAAQRWLGLQTQVETLAG
jgi:glutamate racemase